MAFTFTIPDIIIIVVSDLNKNLGGLTKFGEKRAQISGFAYPSSTPSLYNELIPIEYYRVLQWLHNSVVEISHKCR